MRGDVTAVAAGGPPSRAEAYRAYIASAAWRRNPARLAELAAAGHRCRLCNAAAADGTEIQVHHRTYERLFRERADDLTALCAECHRGVTSMERARRYAGRPVEARDTVRVISMAAPLFDPTRREVTWTPG